MCDEIRKAVGRHGNKETERQIITLSQDSFYRNLTSDESEQAKRGKFNFDHPGKRAIYYYNERNLYIYG